MKSISKRKIFAFLICLVLAFTCFACDFGTYTDSIGKPSGDDSSQVGGNDPSDPNTPTDPTNPGEVDTSTHYIVTVFVNGDMYYFGDNNIIVEWVNKANTRQRYQEPLSATGNADVGELKDGDYYVHLLNVPSDLTYNPNATIAKPTDRHKYISLKSLSKATTGDGKGWYERALTIITPGTYRANVSSATQPVHYYYSPNYTGWYSLTSLVDIFTDEVRPVFTKYGGNFAFVTGPVETVKSGGAEGSYAKNFVYNFKIPPEYVGNIFMFTIEAEQKYGQYPTYVDFELKYEGEAPSPNEYQEIIPKQATRQAADSTKPYHYMNMAGDTNTYNFDVNTHTAPNGTVVSGVRYNARSGCYHLYNIDKYDDDNLGKGWGPRLYCDIEKAGMAFGISLQNAQAATVQIPGEAPQVVNLLRMVASYVGVDYTESKYDEDYNPEGTHIFEEYTEKSLNWDFSKFINDSQRGYIKVANSDGRVYVTKEFKIFLQLFAEQQFLWSDNMTELTDFLGYRTPETNGYFANQDSMWLFACGYYE